MTLMLLKEKIRLFLTFSRNLWYFYFIPILAIGTLSYLKIELSLNSVNPLLVKTLVASFLLYKVFQYLPSVRISGPIIFMTLNTNKIHRLIKQKYVAIIIKCILMSLTIMLIQEREWHTYVQYFLLIYSYFLISVSGYFISWIRYNSDFKNYIFLVSSYFVLMILLFVNQTIIISIIGTVLLIYEIYYLVNKLKINWDKYYNDMKISYVAQINACKNDMARMQMLSLTYNQKKSYNKTSITVLKRANNTKQILFVKAMLVIFRKSKIEFLYSFALFILGVFFLKENKYLYVFLYTIGITNLLNIFKKPIIQIMDKKSKGLYIPIPDKYITNSTLGITYVAVNIVLLATAFFTKLALSELAYLLIVVNILVIISLKYLTMKKNTAIKFIEPIIFFIVFAIIYI